VRRLEDYAVTSARWFAHGGCFCAAMLAVEFVTLDETRLSLEKSRFSGAFFDNQLSNGWLAALLTEAARPGELVFIRGLAATSELLA